MSSHSRKYSPSKSSIWLECPLSTLLNDGTNQTTNTQAEFGTQCHELGATILCGALNLCDYNNSSKSIEDIKNESSMYCEEMQDIANGYATYVVENYLFEKRASEVNPLVVVEQLLDMDFDEDARGTLDCGIISQRDGGTVTVIDLKTGRLPVYAYDFEKKKFNTQLGIYALYFYKAFKDVYPIKKVRLVIYQPVINNTNDYEMSIDDLLDFETNVLLPAVAKTKEQQLIAKSGSHCKWCSGKPVCPQRYNEFISVANEINKPVGILTEKEIEDLLPKLDEVIDYAESVKEYALKKAMDGFKWTKFKLVTGKTSRKIGDEKAVIELCKKEGVDPFSDRKLLGITELTKRMGKERFNTLITPYIVVQEGALTLVPETDPRKEVDIQKEEKKC